MFGLQVNVHVYEKERFGGYKRISCFDVDGARRTIHVLYQVGGGFITSGGFRSSTMHVLYQVGVGFIRTPCTRHPKPTPPPHLIWHAFGVAPDPCTRV